MNLTPLDRIRADRVGPPQLPAQPRAANPAAPQPPTFGEHLKKACAEIGCRTQFSSHAQTRVEDRSIALSSDQLARIDRAVDQVAQKGGRKALVMLDDLALVVGIDRRTVITLVDSPSIRENVFTSIDAAVIA